MTERGGRAPYRKGYNFERRVLKHFEKQGWYVIRQGKSRFPDLWLLKPNEVIPIECKVNKYLSKKEKEQVRNLLNIGFEFYVAYRVNRKLKFDKYERDKYGEIIFKEIEEAG